ncbi:MAG: glycosyltransferase family 39 protein [Spirosomataceae bacterium]
MALYQSPSVFNKYASYWLLAILAVALLLRLYHLDAHGIWFDEKSTMVVSQGIVLDGANQKDVFDKGKLVYTNQEFWREKQLPDYYEAMTRSDIGNSSFYYFLLHHWLNLFGISDFSARLLSVLFSVLTVLLLFVFTKHFFKSNTLALTAAALAAIEPFFIAYSQQARNYSLTFFLTLLASYCFLRALEADEKKQSSRKWFIFYAISALLGLYSHFLVASVLLAHGAYVLFFVRQFKSWVAFSIAGAVAVAGLAWWLLYGGGQYTLFSLNHQSKVYLECALNRPYNNPYGIILPATLNNVFQKSVPMFTDLWVFTNGITEQLMGKKNGVLAGSLGVLLILAYRFSKQKHPKANALFIIAVISMAGSSFVYRELTPGFWVLSTAVFMTYLALEVLFDKKSVYSKKHLWFLVLIGLIPTAFLIFNAVRSGHTYGLMQRYSGFSFPYVTILAGITLEKLGQLKSPIKWVIAAGLGIQLFFVVQTLRAIYADRSPKYTYRIEPRQPNPHYAAAQLAKQLYQAGDTLLLPAPLAKFDNPMDRTYLPYSVVDAQYFNLYLPKDGIFVQKLDTIHVDKIRLKKANGTITELTDLKGKRY